MKNIKFIFAIAVSLLVSNLATAQTVQKGATVNNKGASIKSSTGSGVAAKPSFVRTRVMSWSDKMGFIRFTPLIVLESRPRSI